MTCRHRVDRTSLDQAFNGLALVAILEQFPHLNGAPHNLTACEPSGGRAATADRPAHRLADEAERCAIITHRGVEALRGFLRSDLQKIIEFIVELDKVKAVLRKTKPVGLERYENVAEHSWQVCLLAQLLSQYAPAPLDILRVTELLLVHDIPEIEVGDQIVYQTKDDSRTAAERQAAVRIFGLLPEHQADWLMSRWQEYEDRKTNEAVFAHAIDRLMPVLHNIHNNGQSWRESRVPLEKILTVNAAIGDACPSVWEYVQGILMQLSRAGSFDYGIKDT